MQPEPRSWREILGRVIAEPKEKRNLAQALGVDARTLERWSSGISNPRSHNILQLIDLLPQYRFILTILIAEEFPDVLQRLEREQIVLEEIVPDIAPVVYDQVLQSRSLTLSPMTQWGMRGLVLQSCARQLDQQGQGVAVLLFLCVPSPQGRVHSLLLEQHYCEYSRNWKLPRLASTLFVGTESLAGIVVSSGRPEIHQDTKQIYSLIVPQTEGINAAVAYPIQCNTSIAGCLMVLAQTAQFFSRVKTDLIRKYSNLMALSFKEVEFFTSDEVALQVMPEAHVQLITLSMLNEHIKRLMTIEPDLSRTEAERRVVQQLFKEASQ